MAGNYFVRNYPLILTGNYICYLWLYLLLVTEGVLMFVCTFSLYSTLNKKKNSLRTLFFLVMKTFCSALLPCLVWFRLEVTLKAACKNARISHHNEKGQLKGKVTKCFSKFPEF